MDGMLEKFGIYDLMGIWGAGALTVTYFLLTVWNHIVNFLSFLDITNPIQSELYLLIILYSAVSYFIGVVLQELGKVIFDMSPRFRTENANRLLKCDTIEPYGFGWRVHMECTSILQNAIPSNIRAKLNFDEANSYIKYTDGVDTKRVDKFHSAYALARSLFLCFILHAVFQVASFFALTASCKQTMFFIFVDSFFAWFFYGRAYRYFNSWIRNIFIQYAVEKFESTNTTK